MKFPLRLHNLGVIIMFSVAVLMAKFLCDPFIFLLSYVTNGNSFPKPLTDEEEKYYLGQYKNNDINARNILIERNLRLVAHVVKKFNSQLAGTEVDDLISIGTIGLIKAITTFNPDKGTKLATYAARCIENEILMNMRTSKKLKNEVSLNEAIGIDKEGNEITFLDIVKEEDDEVIDKVDLKLRIKVLCDKMKYLLKDREKLILRMRYGMYDGRYWTQMEIANKLGISRSYVSRIEKKAIKKLNKDMKND